MTTITTAAIANGAGTPFSIERVVLDDLRADEVLVDVVAVGMCHTDLSAGNGTIPFPTPGVLGHEGAGRVRAVGSAVRRAGPGDAVLMSFTSCGRCTACRGGHPAYCESHLPWNLLGGRRADGSPTIRRPDGGALSGHFFGQSSFAHQAVVDERSLVVLEPGTTDEELIRFAPLGCGVQTGAGAVLNVLRPSPDSALVVLGAGAVGLSAVMAASALSVGTVVVVDRVSERLSLARELGASHVVDASLGNAADELRDLTGARGFDAAIETTGSVGVLEMSIAVLAVGGSCLVIGAPAAGARASFDVNAHLPGRRIIGVTLGDSEPERFIPQLIALHQAGRFPLERLERQYPFQEINRAADDAARGLTIKPVLVMEKSV